MAKYDVDLRSLYATTKEFSYWKETNTFVQDASALGLAPGEIPLVVWLKSSKTGKNIDFEKNMCSPHRSDMFEYSAVIVESRQVIKLKIFNS